MKKFIRQISIIATLLVVATVVAIAAPSEAPNAGSHPMLDLLYQVLWVAAGATITSAFFVLVRLNSVVMKQELEDLRAEKGLPPTQKVTKKSTFWSRIAKALHNDVPIEKEKSILFEHEFDGIRELDNKLPSWWVWMFYITTAMGIAYFTYYEVLQIGDSSAEKYAKEMEAGRIQHEAYLKSVASLVNESNAEMLTDASDLAQGKAIFEENCVACHGTVGQGAAVGPNLADNYWLHGGGIKNVFKTVKYGVPAKGMIAWQTQLNPVKIHKVASYIWSLQGSNPDNPKEAQGEEYQVEE
jgi:cytochrome c oxidase cbb3-type subunit 3